MGRDIDKPVHQDFPALMKFFVLIRAVRITKSLSKYDHVSHHLKTLNWLSVTSLIQYRLLCAIYTILAMLSYLIWPPIEFGPQHMHCTQCPEHFANLDCHLHKAFLILCFTLVESRSCCSINSESFYLHGT